MTPSLTDRPWLSTVARERIRMLAQAAANRPVAEQQREVERLAAQSRRIHDVECINLNPATNVMNPRAEALLSSGLGSRPSLGYPGDKYETGLEAVEQIEVIAAELAAEVFGARYAEIRVPSGAIANLYAFLATCEPGDTIIAPPPSIGGHVTHHAGGSAGMYRLHTVAAPVDPTRYSVDVDALRALAHEVRPAVLLRRANLLTCGIGLPLDSVEGDMNGLRIGTPEIVRRGMAVQDMPELADLIVRGLRSSSPEESAAVGRDVTAWRAGFGGVHFTADQPD